MDEPYLGEIHLVAFNFAPRGYAFCSGQMLPINQYQALYSLLCTTFGGNGVTTFALPNLNGRIPVGTGTLAGSSNYVQGQQGGQEDVTLVPAQLPAHVHQVAGTLKTTDSPDGSNPAGNLPASDGGRSMYSTGAANVQMAAAVTGTTGNTGGSQAHPNRMPYLALNYVIALQGIYPSRS